MGVVCSIVSIKSKLEYLVMMYMFLGNAYNHTGSTYHILNILTKLTVLSYDVIWLNKTYYKYVTI